MMGKRKGFKALSMLVVIAVLFTFVMPIAALAGGSEAGAVIVEPQLDEAVEVDGEETESDMEDEEATATGEAGLETEVEAEPGTEAAAGETEIDSELEEALEAEINAEEPQSDPELEIDAEAILDEYDAKLDALEEVIAGSSEEWNIARAEAEDARLEAKAAVVAVEGEEYNQDDEDFKENYPFTARYYELTERQQGLEDLRVELPEAAIIYSNGTIVTVDEDMSYAEAVAVDADGKIIAVGSKSEVMKAVVVNENTKEVDLDGNTMLPGFVDAHSHFSGVGTSLLNQVQLQSPPIGDIKNIDDLVAALKARAEVTPKGEAVLGVRYDDYFLEEGRHPTRWDLDQVSTEHPIKVTHFSGHGHVVNSYALEKAGITKDTPDPTGGGVMGRDKNGEPNGQFFDCNMVPSSVFPRTSTTNQLEALAAGSEAYASQGATTVNNGAGSSLNTFKLHEEAVEKGYLKVRSTLWTSVNGGKQIRDYVGNKTGITKADWDEKGMIASTGIKYFSDGSPQLRTAYMTDPYYDTGDLPEDWVSQPTMSPEQLIQSVVDAHEAGFDAIYIHANGDAAVDMVLDAYEEVRKEGYRQSDDPRHTVIHCQFNREDQYDRMAELGGIIPSHYILHTYYLGDRHKDIFFGEERAKRMSAAQDAVVRGLIHTFHSDTPVLPHKPLEMIWCGVNRLSYHGQEIFTTEYDAGSKYRSIDQRVTPEEALKAVTINAAYEQFIEDVVGSIEVGKWADFVILEENPLTVDPMHIKDIKVLETIVGDKTIYKLAS
jgi:predicted amidohydrolase YtcJ